MKTITLTDQEYNLVVDAVKNLFCTSFNMLNESHKLGDKQIENLKEAKEICRKLLNDWKEI